MEHPRDSSTEECCGSCLSVWRLAYPKNDMRMSSHRARFQNAQRRMLRVPQLRDQARRTRPPARRECRSADPQRRDLRSDSRTDRPAAEGRRRA